MEHIDKEVIHVKGSETEPYLLERTADGYIRHKSDTVDSDSVRWYPLNMIRCVLASQAETIERIDDNQLNVIIPKEINWDSCRMTWELDITELRDYEWKCE